MTLQVKNAVFLVLFAIFIAYFLATQLTWELIVAHMLHDKDIDTLIGLLLRFAEGAARLMGLPALVALCTEEMIALLAFDCIFNPTKAHLRNAELEKMAEQIATLCSTLGEYPSIRYRA